MKQKQPGNRRDFIRSVGGLGALSTYALAVRVPDLRAQAAQPPAPDFNAIAPDESGQPSMTHEPHMTVVELTCDFLVAGGGMAGVCAAIAAARQGARVVLAQNRSRLGGNASSEVRMHMVGADHHGHRPGWREGGLLEELRVEDAVRNPHWSWESWDLMLYDKVISEPNITLLLDTSVYSARVEDGVIREVLARCDLSEYIYRVRAIQYADCTGDCRLGLEAGAEYRTGHESREAFGESLAPETEGPGTLGSSILCTAKPYDHPVPFTPPSWARKVSKEHLRLRPVRSWEYGYWWIEWGGLHDAIRDNERIRFELLSIVLGVWDYIKNSGDHPDSAQWGMDWIGMIPCKRASRRLVGAHILTQNDMTAAEEVFDDAVCIGGWPFDNHPPTGFDDPDIPPYMSVRIDEVYSIPLRSLYSANIHNLFMAGRNISASHVAFTSTRVMGTCAVEGQAIGTAAALCAREGIAPQRLYEDKALLAAFQQQLLRDDQTIKGLANRAPLDLARRAAVVRASDEVEGSRAANVVNGFVRDLPSEWRNRWGGRLQDGAAWIELQWDAPQTIGHVQLCFDTGFDRELTLSESHVVRNRQQRGPQPETVRDYRLLYKSGTGDDWRDLMSVRGNYQRLRRHTFEPVTADALRIEITATNGAPEARVYEIRCYA
jgi:hypothetical protein